MKLDEQAEKSLSLITAGGALAACLLFVAALAAPFIPT